MKRSFLSLALISSSFLPATCFCADLAGSIQSALNDKLLTKAHASIDIVRLDDNRQDVALYDLHPAEPLVPASNLKLITTSAAMERLGPDFQFRTRLYAHGKDLVLIGDGDPSLGDAVLLKKAGWDVDTVFKTWAQGLAAQKIPGFTSLIVDDSVFDDEFIHPNWPADQEQNKYVAEVAGLNLNTNCLDVYVKPTAPGQVVNFATDPATQFVTINNTCKTGRDNSIWLSRDLAGNQLILRGSASQANEVPVAVTIHDGPMYAGTVLAEAMAHAGVKIASVVRDRTMRDELSSSKGSGWTLLAEHATPLTAVMARANKDSMNLYAECCCKRLGYAIHGEGSWAAGTLAVGEFLHAIGVPASEYHLDDGCGLSKQNAISSNLMVSVLRHDFHSPNAEAFRKTMAVAATDGTMLDRFRGTDLKGRVFAKSGFVNGVSCLSGYLHAKDDRWYAFSILFNGIPIGGTADAKAIEEKIVRAIDINSVR